MKNVVLIDLEKNPIQATSLRTYIEDDQLVYLFNLTGQFDYKLQDMAELAGWMSAGLIVILDVPIISKKEYEYAMIAGQLLALIEENVEIELISKNKNIQILIEILQHSGHPVRLHIADKKSKADYTLPTHACFQARPMLRQVKKYCDALAHMNGLPIALDGLKSSIGDILKIPPKQIPSIVEMLIDLEIIKRDLNPIRFRKKNLNHWINLDLNELIDIHPMPLTEPVQRVKKDTKTASIKPQVVVGDVDSIMQFLQQQQAVEDGPFPPELDELQWQALQKLDELQHERPKDIFSLRDQLCDWFPKADIQMLMRSLVDKGYLQLNDDQLHYTAQMVIH